MFDDERQVRVIVFENYFAGSELSCINKRDTRIAMYVSFHQLACTLATTYFAQ